jgi:putative oxidoreductase
MAIWFRSARGLPLKKSLGSRIVRTLAAYNSASRFDSSWGRTRVAISTDIPRDPRSSSLVAGAIDTLVALCGVVPYALVALGLRFIIARVFFLSGQTKIVGPEIPISLFWPGADFTIVLPAAIKPSTLALFEMQYAAMPLSPTVAAYLFTYAEFVLPVCLILGFATRLSALALLVMTVLIQVYVAPDALWSAHVYLFAILMVLMSVGPGAISLDALIRHVYRR